MNPSTPRYAGLTRHYAKTMETIKILFLEEATEKSWKGNARADRIAIMAENEEARLSPRKVQRASTQTPYMQEKRV